MINDQWGIYESIRWTGKRFQHVVPEGDLVAHWPFRCWCRPSFDEGIFTHHSYDQREAFEQGVRKPS